MENIKESQVFKILNEIADMNIEKHCHNERYLHHYFTEKIQKDYPIIYNDLDLSKLHPEWATLIKNYRNGGKYKKIENEYKIDNDNGTSGFIDFVLGDYDKPEIGIEFKFCKSWNFQSLVFDYIKLLDSANSIQKAISFSIIYREKELSNELTLDKIKETITVLKNRLDGTLDINREFLLWIIEIAPHSKKKQKRSWFCDNLDKNFVEGTPFA